MKKTALSKVLFLLLSSLFFTMLPLHAQGPLDQETFFYQGVLRVDGVLVEGPVDLQFHLYDSADVSLRQDLGFTQIDSAILQDGLINAKLS